MSWLESIGIIVKCASGVLLRDLFLELRECLLHDLNTAKELRAVWGKRKKSTAGSFLVLLIF